METEYIDQTYRISSADEDYPGSIIKIVERRCLTTGESFFVESRTNYMHAQYLSDEQKHEMIETKKATGQDKKEPLIFKTALVCSGLYSTLSDDEKVALNQAIELKKNEYLESLET